MKPWRLVAVALILTISAPASAETYRHVWTSTGDFQSGSLVNTNATDVADQLQLNLNNIETPYLWVANTGSSTVSQIDTATGRVLAATSTPYSSPSRTAVDIDFNCWVAYRGSDGRASKLSVNGATVLGSTPRVGSAARGVAITADGDVWISTSSGAPWARHDPETFQPNRNFTNALGSYGLSVDPFGKIFSTTSWLSGQAIQRVDSASGHVEQTWRLTSEGGNVYGIVADIEGNAWGAIWANDRVVWIDGDYQCPNNLQDCPISAGNGLLRSINVRNVIRAAGGTNGGYGGRGIAVDANGFVWAVFNDLGTSGWPTAVSYAVKIDGTTGDPIAATRVGTGAIGITPDADGFIWVVNYSGGGANYVNHACPQGHSGNGSINKLRSSDGSVVATYPTCGSSPYTYSDMAGYTLRSVTLRSGTWRATHDSGQPGREWGRIRWTSREFDETTLRLRVRVADSVGALAAAPFAEVTNGGLLPFQGRFMEVEAFLFTRNDFLGPVIEDITIEGICEATPEICDGFDNDCNRLVDDGNPGGGARCDTGLRGVCAIGERQCDRGEFVCRTLGTPQDEICNDIDDNCDGRVDEGVTNLCGECGDEPDEVCDGEDNDCDGLTDEGVLNACNACGPTPVEVCDGEDNDCDGLVDEGLVNACGGCGPTPDEVCDGEDNDCDGLIDDGVANACGGCGPTPDEVCDGEDNDCDGLVDEGLINACGTCGPAPEEICDGLDNNCNGRVDEGVLNACGFCGEVPEEVCDGADNDCDGDVDEGLANRCGGCGEEPVEVCNGVDDNCDGEVDEGVANACGSCGIVPEEVCDGTDNDCDGEIDERVLNACGQCGDLGPDVCDGVDGDCDGEIDENPECVEGRSCVEGECAEPCAAGECPRGFYCRDNACLIDRCLGLQCADGQICRDGTCLEQNDIACEGVMCEGDEVCVNGTCGEDPCTAVDCPDGEACWLGECLDDGAVACRQVTCGTAEVCEDGICVEDPCLQVRCENGFVCNAGECEDACLHTTCNQGFECNSGVCVEDSCFNVVCEESQTCIAGNCLWDACVNVECAQDEQCGPDGCETLGACGDSVCTETEFCRNGACVDRDQLGGDNNGNGGNNGGGGGGSSGGASDSPGGCATATETPSGWRLLLRR
jgi:hypothetical protein